MRNRFKVYLSIAMMTLGIISLVSSGTDFRFFTQPVWNPIAQVKTDNYEASTVGRTITIFDKSGNIVSKMARNVHVGDEIINAKGQHFKVIKVDGDKATAKLLGINKDYLSWADYFTNLNEVPVVANADKDRPVAIYHTHSAESYKPTDGAAFRLYNGGILEVGKVFADKLEQQGVKVLLSDNKHDPQDSNAYVRSRRTVVELMKQNPIAMFDIHRDGIPDPNFYYKTVSGKDVTQLRLVVGRQNPKMSANKDFAKRIMAYSNQKHPGIVKEIFMGKGNFNQDLLSTAVLIEAGTYTNKREKAEEGITLLADAIPVVLGVSPGAAGSSEAGAHGWKIAGWILGIVLLGGGVFLLISAGSWRGATERLGGLGKEFGDLWAPLRKKKLSSRDKPDETKNE